LPLCLGPSQDAHGKPPVPGAVARGARRKGAAWSFADLAPRSSADILHTGAVQGRLSARAHTLNPAGCRAHPLPASTDSGAARTGVEGCTALSFPSSGFDSSFTRPRSHNLTLRQLALSEAPFQFTFFFSCQTVPTTTVASRSPLGLGRRTPASSDAGPTLSLGPRPALAAGGLGHPPPTSALGFVAFSCLIFLGGERFSFRL
jgi:hypothetical protein